jgi:hypothetical protein
MFCLFVFAALLSALAPKDPPRLEVTPPGQVDLGSVGPREGRVQAYVFRNASATPIRLRVLDLSPGVTVAGPALTGPIPSGTGAGLTLKFEPEDWQGPQTRNVRLATDDPRQGEYYLPVQVFIRPDLTVDGVRRDFGDRAAYESPVAVFTFTRETGQPLALRLATDLPTYLEGEVRPEGGRSRLCFTLRPERVPPGERLGLERVRVETNAPLQPSFDLYLAWRIHHAVDADPPRVVLQDPGSWVAELRLTARDGKPFRLLKAEVEGEAFVVEPFPDREASVQVLTLRRRSATPTRGMLVLSFQGQDRPLRVPLAYLPSTPRARSSENHDHAEVKGPL